MVFRETGSVLHWKKGPWREESLHLVALPLTQKSPCSGGFGFGFPATDEAAHSPPPVTTQKYGQADGSGFFPLNQ